MFKYFNPIWLINNFLQPSIGPEILVPAAIGAVGSAAMGKSPITGALVGGVTGGVLDKFNLGSGLLSSVKGVEGAAPSLGSGGYAALGQTGTSGIGGAATGGINFQNIGSTFPVGGQGVVLPQYQIGEGLAKNLSDDVLLTARPDGLGTISTDLFGTPQVGGAGINFGNISGADPRRLAVDTPLTIGERVSDLGSGAMSYAQQNPMTVLGAGKSLLDVYNQAEEADKQRLNQAVAAGSQPIAKGKSDIASGRLLNIKRIG